MSHIFWLLHKEEDTRTEDLFNPNSSSANAIRNEYKDETLFRDPAFFTQDLLRYLKKGHPVNNYENGKYLVDQVFPYVIKKHQLDKIAERAGEIIQKMMGAKPGSIACNIF